MSGRMIEAMIDPADIDVRVNGIFRPLVHRPVTQPIKPVEIVAETPKEEIKPEPQIIEKEPEKVIEKPRRGRRPKNHG